MSQDTKEKIDDDVIGFYELLFEVDKRINPHLYENDLENKNNKILN